MVTISHLTKKYLQDSFLLQEYLEEGLINYVALAEKIKPRIEKELGKKIKTSAIMMALRRHSEKLKIKEKIRIPLEDATIIMKTGLCDITVAKSLDVLKILKEIYKLVDYEKGDTLNIIQGDSDISIIISSRYKEKVLDLLKGEKILNIEENLISLTVRFGISCLHIPGVTYIFLKALVMEGINLIEVVSSLVETSFIINKKDATKGYNALEGMIEKS